MALEILIELFLLVVALIALSFSSNKTLESAEKLSHFFGISQLTIGFIFISILTSLPELSVAVFSSATGNNNLSLGDLLGSNVTNIALVFGLLVFLSKKDFVLSRKRTNQILLYLFMSFVPIILFLDGFLSLIDGLILLVLYIFFLKQILDSREKTMTFNNIDKRGAGKEFLVLLASIFVVLLSSEFVVESAINIADGLGIFASFLGATLIAFNTSIPELALMFSALKKRYTNIAIGNLIGSNVVNITLLLGLNILINPFSPNTQIGFLVFSFILLSSGFIVYKLLTTGKLSRMEGMALLSIYALYLLSLTTIQIVLR